MKKAILFREVPRGTHYRKGAWSWVKEPKASEYLRDGYGVEWDVEKGKKKESSLPTGSSLKSEIIQYLDEHGIEFDESLTKSELLELL